MEKATEWSAGGVAHTVWTHWTEGKLLSLQLEREIPSGYAEMARSLKRKDHLFLGVGGMA